MSGLNDKILRLLFANVIVERYESSWVKGKYLYGVNLNVTMDYNGKTSITYLNQTHETQSFGLSEHNDIPEAISSFSTGVKKFLQTAGCQFYQIRTMMSQVVISFSEKSDLDKLQKYVKQLESELNQKPAIRARCSC